MVSYPDWLEDSSGQFKADILAFGPHPDDVELNIGGILALHSLQHKVVVVDLTAGEMSSNGTCEERRQESQKAAKILGLTVRRNLYLPDGGLRAEADEQQKRVVAAIRYYQPEIVLLPFWEDRHPDHAAASKLIDICLFKSGLKKYHTISDLQPYRPAKWYYYFQHHYGDPDLVVDISEMYQKKVDAINAYQSQFRDSDNFKTFINQPVFLRKVLARDEYFGGMVGVSYGEGLVYKLPMKVKNLL